MQKQSSITIHSLLVLTLIVLSAGCSSSNVGAPEQEMGTPLVAQFGQHKLDLHEFEDEYARSVGGRDVALTDSLPQYEDFLDRYVDFRLKVLYAQEIGLDQDSSLKAEIETYHKQLARPYLLEKEILDPILQDLYEKKQTMVDASHILIRVGRDAPQDEVDAARAKMTAIRDSALQGVDFGELAYRNSEDPSARSNRVGARGRLGYFVGGMMVKEFEDQAYSTPVDSVSEVFRSNFGFHILTVHDRAPKIPARQISHIAIRHFQPSVRDSLSPEDRIAAIKAELDAGADFSTLAQQKSEDRESGSRGGLLGQLAYTQQGMPDSFKEAAFSLEKPGDYSDVIRTDYGYHILRLDGIEELLTFEQSYTDLKTQAARLPRVKAAETEMARKIREASGTSVDSMLTLEILAGRHFRSPDILETPDEQMEMTIASLGDQNYTFGEVVDFAETASIPFQPDTTGLVFDAIDRFLNEEALNQEAARLEDNDMEFKRILDEFQSGLLLFKLMEDSVWTAAAMDTAGLKAYHAPRADSFWFEDRTRILSLRSMSDSLLQSYITELDAGTSPANLIAAIEKDTLAAVAVDTTYLVGPNNSVFDRALNLNPGEYTDAIRNSSGFIVMINDGEAPARKKTFEEARPEVLNAYQAEVEQKLLARLRDKYDAKKYKAVLRGAFAAAEMTESAANAGAAAEDAMPEPSDDN